MGTELKIGDMTFTAVVVGSKTSEKLPIDNFGLVEIPFCDMENFCDICIGNICMRKDYAECPHFLAMKRIEGQKLNLEDLV